MDVKLVLTETGNAAYRARIAARMVEIGGRTDVPIGVGIHLEDEAGPQAPWVEGYELSSYSDVDIYRAFTYNGIRHHCTCPHVLQFLLLSYRRTGLRKPIDPQVSLPSPRAERRKTGTI